MSTVVASSTLAQRMPSLIYRNSRRQCSSSDSCFASDHWTSSRGKKASNRSLRARATADEDVKTEKKPSGKGWFYDKFVAEYTWQAKLEKLEKTLEKQGNMVDTYFDGAFKYTIWMEVFKSLVASNLKSVSVSDAYNLSKAGVILLDCREPQDFAKAHAVGAKNAPLFRLIQGNDFKANLRRLGHALITDFNGTERNPEFINNALEAVGGNKSQRIAVYCGRGGTLETVIVRGGKKPKSYKDPERAWGRASSVASNWANFYHNMQGRSLKAIYELQQAGFTNIVHVDGGFNEWLHQELPIEGTDV